MCPPGVRVFTSRHFGSRTSRESRSRVANDIPIVLHDQESSRSGRSPRPRASRGSRFARRWWCKELQLAVDHYACDLASRRRDPLLREPGGQFFESRPVLRLQRNLLNLRRPLQSRPPARGANPALELPPQCMQADRGAVNICPGDNLRGPERFGDDVRAYRPGGRSHMSNCASGVARNLEFACHACLRHSSYSLIRKNHDPSAPLSSTTTISWFVSRPKRCRNSRSAATCARNRSGLM